MSSKTVVIVIPARMNSSRLPGKPLRKIAGKPLLTSVVEIAQNVVCADDVVVATDHPDIEKLALQSNVEVFMTSQFHNNGTERLIEVSKKKAADFYINLQGDEPLILSSDIELLINELISSKSDIVTLSHPISSEEANNSSRVKVVCNSLNEALYFSRAKIPYGEKIYHQHIGIYGFTKNSLEIISRLNTSRLENVERLEQLRWLYSNLKIKVLSTDNKSTGVDTIDDLHLADMTLRLRNIQLIISDVDGVLTNGQLIYSKYGEELKCFNSNVGFSSLFLSDLLFTLSLKSSITPTK